MTNPFSSIGSVSLMQLALNKAERAEMRTFLQELVQMPSLPTQEKAVAGLIKEQLKAVGVEDITVDEVGNVIARLGTGEGPTLLIDAHMDTVAPSNGDWPFGPYDAIEEDGYVYGLGACDMKGAAAALVFAAKRLVESKVAFRGTLILAFVVQEEPCEGCALRVIVEEQGIRPDAVLLCEPSDMRVMLGHRGRVLFRVTVSGRSSHASIPERGVNAITAAARLIFGIEMLAADMPNDPLMGPGTVTVTHIESNASSNNAVPHTCSFLVDRRLTLGETAARAQSQIEALIEQEGLNADIEIVTYQASSYKGYDFEVDESFSAWSLATEHELVTILRSTVRIVCGEEHGTGYWQFSTDGVYSMGEANIPTLGLGPGDPSLAHSVMERVSLKDVADAAQIYAAFSVMLVGS